MKESVPDPEGWAFDAREKRIDAGYGWELFHSQNPRTMCQGSTAAALGQLVHSPTTGKSKSPSLGMGHTPAPTALRAESGVQAHPLLHRGQAGSHGPTRLPRSLPHKRNKACSAQEADPGTGQRAPGISGQDPGALGGAPCVGVLTVASSWDTEHPAVLTARAPLGTVR